MKSLLSLTFLLLFYIASFGQITISSSDMPAANDTLRYSFANLDTLILNNYTKTGAGYSWDFSKLKPTSQNVDQYKLGLQTPYAIFFYLPTKYGLKVADSLGVSTFKFTDIYNFYQKTSSAFLAEGMGMKFSGIPIPSFYTDKDEIYSFPLNYSDSDSSTFYFKTSVPTLFDFVRAGYRINYVDGWGTIKTPYGSFSCLRVVTVIVEVDSIIAGVMKFGFPLIQMEYKWLAKNIKFPILEVTGTRFGNMFTPNQVRYRDIYRGINSPLAPKSIFIADKTNALVNETITFTNKSTGSGNYYVWYFNPNKVTYLSGTDSTSKDPVVKFSQAGNYTVKLRSMNLFGSHDTTKIGYISITDPVMIHENEILNLKIYPNPVEENSFFITYSMNHPDRTKIRLMDVTGKEIAVLSDQFEFPGEQKHRISLSNFGNLKGIYFVEISTNEKIAISKLFIKF